MKISKSFIKKRSSWIFRFFLLLLFFFIFFIIFFFFIALTFKLLLLNCENSCANIENLIMVTICGYSWNLCGLLSSFFQIFFDVCVELLEIFYNFIACHILESTVSDIKRISLFASKIFMSFNVIHC